MSASYMGKLSTATTIRLLHFFPLCLWPLKPLELSQHCVTDTGRTCCLNYNHSIVHIFWNCHVSHTFVRFFCRHLYNFMPKELNTDRDGWHKKNLISIFIFVPLADITLQQLCETWVFHKDNWQTTEMPDEVNAITQIKACLEKKNVKKCCLAFHNI